jgi:hypothetical protein
MLLIVIEAGWGGSPKPARVVGIRACDQTRVKQRSRSIVAGTADPGLSSKPKAGIA